MALSVLFEQISEDFPSQFVTDTARRIGVLTVWRHKQRKYFSKGKNKIEKTKFLLGCV
jgi:hypothetical protein